MLVSILILVLHQYYINSVDGRANPQSLSQIYDSRANDDDNDDDDNDDAVNIGLFLIKFNAQGSLVYYLELNISRTAGAKADASGCIAMHFIQTPSI